MLDYSVGDKCCLKTRFIIYYLFIIKVSFHSYGVYARKPDGHTRGFLLRANNAVSTWSGLDKHNRCYLLSCSKWQETIFIDSLSALPCSLASST